MMSLLQAFFFLSLVVSLATAVPSPQKLQKRGVFKVERVRNVNFRGRNGPRTLAKVYRKYGRPLPSGLLDAMNNGGQSTSTNSLQSEERKSGMKGTGKGFNEVPVVSTTNQTITPGTGLVTAIPETNDVEYLSPITVGGQTLNVDFDSGSSDLWIFNSQLGTQVTKGHQVYDPAKSNTFLLLDGQTFTISYGDGSGAAGNVGVDMVDVGGATVTQQAIELATTVSESFVEDNSDNGLMGLAFSKLNTVTPQQQKTFFDNVMDSLAEPVFTADLRPNSVGAYEFGRIDTTKFTGEMAWVPVNTTQGFWQFSTSTFSVGDSESQLGPTGSQAIADTGTTLLLSSSEVVSGYYSQVPSAQISEKMGGVVFDCDEDLPDLMLDVGGVYMARVNGSDINFAAIDEAQNVCFGGLQESPVSGMQVWGDIFFKSQFVAFNGGNNSLGMAQHIF